MALRFHSLRVILAHSIALFFTLLTTFLGLRICGGYEKLPEVFGQHAKVVAGIHNVEGTASSIVITHGLEILRRDDTPQPLSDQQWADRLAQTCSLSQWMNKDAATAEKYYHANPKLKDSPLQSPFYDVAEEFQKWGWEDAIQSHFDWRYKSILKGIGLSPNEKDWEYHTNKHSKSFESGDSKGGVRTK